MNASKIVIRPTHPDDAQDLYEIVSHPQVARTLLQLPSMEFSETLNWIKQVNPGQHRLVAELNGRVRGQITLDHFQNPRLKHAGRLGMMVHPDYWNQGVGTALMTAAMDIADNWLDLKRVQLEVFPHNKAAVHLYEKFGFQFEGQRRCAAFGDGRWLDDLVMARLRDVDSLQVSRELPAAEPRIKPTMRRLLVRPFHEEDIPALYRLFYHPLVGRTSLQMPSLQLGSFEERMLTDVPGRFRYVAVADDLPVGMISIYRGALPRTSHSAGLGMMVHPDYWGIGVGSRLMEVILDLADNWLGLKRVELEVNTDNPTAIHLYEKFNFVIEGTHRFHTYGAGRWADSHFMARLREEQGKGDTAN